MELTGVFSLLVFLLPLLALGKTHNVQVGVNGLNYHPQSINAHKGDKVVFHFHPGDHSAVEGEFHKPCKPKKGGFFSGFFPKTPGTFTVDIHSSDTKWVYCATDGHCPLGMSMVINPPKHGNTIKKYQKRSKKATSAAPGKVRGGKRKVGGHKVERSSEEELNEEFERSVVDLESYLEN